MAAAIAGLMMPLVVSIGTWVFVGTSYFRIRWGVLGAFLGALSTFLTVVAFSFLVGDAFQMVSNRQAQYVLVFCALHKLGGLIAFGVGAAGGKAYFEIASIDEMARTIGESRGRSGDTISLNG